MTEQNFQTFVIPLPSGGLNYTDDCAFKKGTVELKYGTSREETILMDRQLIRNGTVLDELLKSLMIEKEDVSKLFPGDFNALVIAARVSMYGNIWEVKVPCPSCGVEQEIKIDISEFDNFKNTEEFENGTLVYESTQGNKFEYKILSKKEIVDYDKFVISMKKKNIPCNQIGELFFRSIISVNGETNKADNKIYFNSMSSLESRELREHINQNSPDINLFREFECPSCGHSWDSEIELDISFFWRSGSRKQRI